MLGADLNLCRNIKFPSEVRQMANVKTRTTVVLFSFAFRSLLFTAVCKASSDNHFAFFKGEKERYTHLNAKFQRKVRRDKKAFLSDQCNEIEENNRMGKTRDVFKNETVAHYTE